MMKPARKSISLPHCEQSLTRAWDMWTSTERGVFLGYDYELDSNTRTEPELGNWSDIT